MQRAFSRCACRGAYLLGMRTLLIYTSVLEDEYKVAYEHLAAELSQHKVTTFLSLPPERYLGHGRFTGGFAVSPSWEPRLEPLAVDSIFNKSLVQFLDDTVQIINHPIFDRACDKDRTIELFPNDCPRSLLVESTTDLVRALDSMRTDRVVTKPTALFGGQGVHIGPKHSLPREPTFPFILQEFVDTAGGIPGICRGRHDLRLIYFGNRLVDAYVRQPAKNGYLSNVAQGGSIRQVPIGDLPLEAQSFAVHIDAAFQHFPDRVYSIDIGLDADGTWKLIELNSPPGLPLEEDERGDHIALLAEHLATAARTVDPHIVAP